MGDMTTRKFALWLIPSSGQRPQLLSMIQALASKHGLPPFQPHVTLASGVHSGELNVLHRRAQDLCTALGPISFGVSGVRWTNSYFTFLFLSLVDESSVFKRAASFFPRSDLASVGPHLSLAYSDRYEGINRTEIAQAIAADMPESILCTSLELVIPAGGEWGEIENWLSYPIAEFVPPPGALDAAWTARGEGAKGMESAMARGRRQ